MDIDGEYVWSETVLEEKGPQYKTELNQYTKGKMIFQMDQSYEHDAPYFADNEDAQWIRRKMYEGLLSGCAGTSFSSGTVDNQCYMFKNCKALMSTQGMHQARFCFKLFESRSWEKLIPDTSQEIILLGRGNYGDLDYICAARVSDGSTDILYIPHGHILSINIKRIADSPMNCFWYNPVSGTSLSIGTVSNVEKFYFAAPSPEDWVLVLDKTDLKLPKL